MTDALFLSPPLFDFSINNYISRCVVLFSIYIVIALMPLMVSIYYSNYIYLLHIHPTRSFSVGVIPKRRGGLRSSLYVNFRCSGSAVFFYVLPSTSFRTD